jgi:leucyl aminopeptidase
MLVKLATQPSMFMRGLPIIKVYFDDQEPNETLKTFVIRRMYKYIDCDKLVNRVQCRMHDSKRGIIIDLRNLNEEDAIFFAHVLTKKCWQFKKYQTRTHARLLDFDKTLFIWHNKISNKYLHKQIEAANIAREIASEPSNKIGGTQGFCNRIRAMFSKRAQVKVTVLDSKQLEEKGLGLIKGMGGSNDPKLIIIDYNPKKKRTICLVGKGVCFDSGGYALKGLNAMYGMHTDKTGAAIVIGALKYACDVSLCHRIVGVIPVIENLIGDLSPVPGDVLTAYNGLTVEIVNPDAEGRVIVADALAYATENYSPDLVMDFGTFTRNNEHCGAGFQFFTLNKSLSETISNVGEKIGERSIILPPWAEYIEHIRGNTADIVNISSTCGQSSTVIAALFLMNFVTDKARYNGWVHFDVSNNSPNTNISYCNSLATILNLITRFRIAK